MKKILVVISLDIWGLHTNFASESNTENEKEQLNSIIEIYPVRNVVARFGNKWALLVRLVLSENEPIRYNELGRKIPDNTGRSLVPIILELTEWA